MKLLDLYIYDQNFVLKDIVDNYRSLIWTERFNSCGDFELDALYDPDLYRLLVSANGLTKNYYAGIRDSDVFMLIEDVTLTTDYEDGDKMTVTGRSLESILDRRIVYDQMTLTGSLQNGIKSILMANAISPSNVSRTIPGLSFITSTDSDITSLTINTQYYGDNVYNVIEELCQANKIGFRVRRVSNGYTFELYKGVNRTASQSLVPYVIFSPAYDNLINSNYHESSQLVKTVAIVASEYETTSGETTITQRVVIEQQADSSSSPTGLDRRELFVDGSSVNQRKDDDSGDLTLAQYKAALQGKGKEELNDYTYTKEFDAEVESALQFKYGVDYFIGDLVEIENEYGISSQARVTEFIRSNDTNGYSEYPTFETNEE